MPYGGPQTVTCHHCGASYAGSPVSLHVCPACVDAGHRGTWLSCEACRRRREEERAARDGREDRA